MTSLDETIKDFSSRSFRSIELVDSGKASEYVKLECGAGAYIGIVARDAAIVSAYLNVPVEYKFNEKGYRVNGQLDVAGEYGHLIGMRNDNERGLVALENKLHRERLRVEKDNELIVRMMLALQKKI